ncbi:MAG: RHS repeat-associated core domain-containing protein [Polyangiaceae bacterium]|nr:RHS repeat-associated core domain-containing protein [Polyangiaceae bacterium]
MVRFGARDYDPETGTWLTPEPLGFAAGDNFYAYAAGNPVAYNDPTGLAPSRAELTFLAELFGVGSTASMINERDASIEAVSHGDIGKAECHAAAAVSASVGAVVEIGMLAATRGGRSRYRQPELDEYGKYHYQEIPKKLPKGRKRLEEARETLEESIRTRRDELRRFGEENDRAPGHRERIRREESWLRRIEMKLKSVRK